jgi:hypothetical protein
MTFEGVCAYEEFWKRHWSSELVTDIWFSRENLILKVGTTSGMFSEGFDNAVPQV